MPVEAAMLPTFQVKISPVFFVVVVAALFPGLIAVYNFCLLINLCIYKNGFYASIPLLLLLSVCVINKCAHVAVTITEQQ